MALFPKKVFELSLINMHYLLCRRMVNKMKYWQYICAALFLLAIIISRKTSVLKIFIEQLKIYKDDRNGKFYWLDILTFLILPAVIAVVTALNLPLSKIVNNADSIITVFSIIITLPLSFLALLIDRVLKNSKAEEVAKETFVSITVDILYAILIIGLVLFAALTPLCNIFQKVIVGVVVFLTVKLILNILMILKRIFNSY